MNDRPSLALRATDAQITEWGIVFADGLPLELVGSLSCALPEAVIDAGLGHVFGGVVAAFSADSQREWRAHVEELLLERYPDPVERWARGLHAGKSSCALYAALIAPSDDGALTAVQRAMGAHHPHDAADYQRCVDMVRYADALSEAWHERQETIRAHAPEAWRPWLARLADELRATT